MADTVDFENLSMADLRQFVGIFVELSLCDGGKSQGWVYTVDPVSRAIVLAKKPCPKSTTEDKRLISIVMANAVKKLRVLETMGDREPAWLATFTTERQHGYSEEEVLTRKTRMLEWLKKNRVPIMETSCEDDMKIEIIGGVVIEPPYDGESCQGTNEIVLDRMRKLVKSLPKT